jgi:hypothetical protein
MAPSHSQPSCSSSGHAISAVRLAYAAPWSRIRERAFGDSDEDVSVSGRIAPRARAALVISAMLVIGGACGDDNGGDGLSGPSISSSSTSRAGSTADEVRLMLLDEPSWQLTEAVDYRAGLGAIEALDPDLDWFAEYDGSRADNPDGSYTVPHVATSGHSAGLERRRGQLPGFEPRSEVVAGRQALVASAADGNPAVVILELAADYTATLLTYDAGIDLQDLAAHLIAVDEEQWTAAGGSLLDCVPFESGCSGEN